MLPATAPADSPIFRSFVEEACKATSLDEGQVVEALWSLNAHADLIGGLFLFRRLHSLADGGDSFGLDTTGDKRLLDTLSELSMWLSADDVELPPGLENSAFTRMPKLLELEGQASPRLVRNPVDGYGMSRHPLFAMLMHSCEDQVLKPRWDKLALHVLLSGARVFCKHVTLEAYMHYSGKDEHPMLPGSFDAAGRAMRVLSAKTVARELDELGECSLESSWSQAAHRFLDWVSPDAEHLRTVLRFLARCEGRLEWPSSSAGGGGGHRDKPREYGYIEIGNGQVLVRNQMPDQDDGETDQFVTQQIREPGNDDAANGGMDGETPDPNALHIVEGDCKETKTSPASIALAARGRDHALRLAAQRLPWGYEQLTRLEVWELDRVLRSRVETNLGRNADELEAEEFGTLELALQLLISLWLGTDLLVARGTRELTKRESASKSRLCIYAVHANTSDAIERFEWRNEAQMPAYKSGPTSALTVSRKPRGTVYLPDIADLGRFAQSLRDTDVPGRGARDVFRTAGDGDEHKSAARRFLKSLDISDRITLSKIESFAKHRIASETHDLTAAALLTNRDNQESRTRLFYTLTSNTYLRTHYQSVMQAELPPSLRRASDAGDAGAEALTGWCVGARRCVTDEALVDGVASMKSALQAQCSYTDLEGMMAFHNLYVSYVVWFFAFALCARGVTDLYYGADQVDPVTGLSSLRDKDSEFPYHARLVWVMPELLEQMRHFDQHTQAIRGLQALYGMKPGRTGAFYLTSTLRAAPVKPGDWRGHVKDYLDMPMNSNRHYIRTSLLEADCSPETVDALMGHWEFGEEPWAIESSFDVQEYVAELQDHFVPMVTRAGFDLVRSPLVRG